jgi:TPR repeat protein
MLGRYLHRGLASPRDPEQARVWFKRALDNGVRDASAELAKINAEQAAQTQQEPIELTESMTLPAEPAKAPGPQLLHQ